MAAPHQRGADAERAMQARDEIGERWAGPQRRPVRRAGHAHKAAHRLRDEIEGRPVAIGAARAEAADVAIDEIGLELAQAGFAEAHLREHAGAEILDEDVALLDEARQHRPALVASQIE
jgi:hypothetical protein